jgi:hypothetical protein
VLLQPSPALVLPSSQASPGSSRPLPQGFASGGAASGRASGGASGGASGSASGASIVERPPPHPTAHMSTTTPGTTLTRGRYHV